SFAGGEQLALLTDEVWTELGRGFDEFEPLERAWSKSDGAPLLARVTHLDAVTYLPNDILTKVDRASMRVALEVRAPFLARPVVELAFGLPDRYRMRGLTGKRLLRAAASRLLPATRATVPAAARARAACRRTPRRRPRRSSRPGRSRRRAASRPGARRGRARSRAAGRRGRARRAAPRAPSRGRRRSAAPARSA